MSKVFILTEGSYSDYHILAVFSTKELAEKYTKVNPSAGIEEYNLDAPIPLPQTLVVMQQDGTVIYSRLVHDYDIGFNSFWENRGTKQLCLYYVVETDSIERAIKVTNEKRTQILALNLWGNKTEVSKLFKT